MSGYEERLNENRIKQLITTQVPIGITIMQAPSDLPHHSLQGQGEQPESGSSVGDSAAPLSQNDQKEPFLFLWTHQGSEWTVIGL